MRSAAAHIAATDVPFRIDPLQYLARQGAIYTVESEYALDQPSVSSIAAIAASENPK